VTEIDIIRHNRAIQDIESSSFKQKSLMTATKSPVVTTSLTA
jgi:hypothetical protein